MTAHDLMVFEAAMREAAGAGFRLGVDYRTVRIGVWATEAKDEYVTAVAWIDGHGAGALWERIRGQTQGETAPVTNQEASQQDIDPS